jgi:hypothetical protein
MRHFPVTVANRDAVKAACIEHLRATKDARVDVCGLGGERGRHHAARVDDGCHPNTVSGEVECRPPAVIACCEERGLPSRVTPKRFKYVRTAEAIMTPGRSLPPKTIGRSRAPAASTVRFATIFQYRWRG